MDPNNALHVERQCPWCSARGSADMRRCPSCDAALVQRDRIGDLVIPGVTDVDPTLSQYAADPLRIPGASPSQSVAGSAIGAAAIVGGPAGLVALGGLAAVAAVEYLGAGDAARQAAAARLGQPSEAVLQMLERIEKDEQVPETPPVDGPETPDESPAQP